MRKQIFGNIFLGNSIVVLCIYEIFATEMYYATSTVAVQNEPDTSDVNMTIESQHVTPYLMAIVVFVRSVQNLRDIRNRNEYYIDLQI